MNNDISHEDWATAALGTILVIVSSADANTKEQILHSLSVLIDNSSPELMIKAVVATVPVVQEIEAMREVAAQVDAIFEEKDSE